MNEVLEATLALVKKLRDGVYDLGGQFDEIVCQLDSLSDAAGDAELAAAKARHPQAWVQPEPVRPRLTLAASPWADRGQFDDARGEDEAEKDRRA